MTKLHIICITIGSILLLLSFSSNPPQGRTGGPGERTCASVGCHSAVTPAFEGHVELNGLPEFITPGITYNLSFDLIVDRGTPDRGGFQMMSLNQDEQNTGMFTNPIESSTLSTTNDRTYFEHDPALRFEGADTLSYTVDWRLPEETADSEIAFYAAANFANGSGASGDRIVTLADTFTVLSTTALTTSMDQVNPSCPGGSDGSVKICALNGTPPYDFILGDIVVTNDTCAVFTNLSAGSVLISAIDSAGLSAETTVVLTTTMDNISPEMFCINDTLTVQTCNPFSYPRPTAMDNCGDVSVTLISGKGPNSSFEQGLHLEIYEAEDDAGNTTRCTIFIENKVVFNASFDIQDIPCKEDSTGAAVLVADGSNPPFSVRSTDETLDLSSLKAGDYSFIVSDATGCQETIELTIGRIDSLQLEVVEVKKPLNSSSGDGSIDINITGGTPPYTFHWRTEDEMFSNDEDLALLFPGDYNVEVMDANGCSIKSDTIRVEAITSTVDIAFSKSILIFPNPADQTIRITHESLVEIDRTEIFNITGQRMWLADQKTSSVNLKSFASGMYILKLTKKDGSVGVSRFQKL